MKVFPYCCHACFRQRVWNGFQTSFRLQHFWIGRLSPEKKVKKVKLQDEFIRISGESVSNYTIIRWSSIPPTQSARLEMKKLLLRLFAVLPVWFYIWSLECVDSLLRRC